MESFSPLVVATPGSWSILGKQRRAMSEEGDTQTTKRPRVLWYKYITYWWAMSGGGPFLIAKEYMNKGKGSLSYTSEADMFVRMNTLPEENDDL
jgi:hypothetical protein